MTDIIAIFLLSMILSLFFTPRVGQIAKKYNLTDSPSERKVHTKPIPRVGGVAIFLAFYLSFVPMYLFSTGVFELINPDFRLIYLFCGGMVVFCMGLWDDIKSLSPYVKIAFQVLAALIIYIGDIRITYLGLPGMRDWYLGWLSLPITVFWVFLVVNAINLIDGLDGLAAGISFFVCMVLIILCAVGEKFLIAILLAALAGAILGFLRYNFNPASIFMGDSGSYFLGYMLATLSIMGTIKSQITVSILIPIIAMGLPLMDALWAPIRRFILGQGLFKPDKDHFHHRLLKLGLTQRSAVGILYCVTILMSILSMGFVYIRNERAALILIFIGAAVIFGIRRLGYLEYFAMDKVYGWLKDITDEAGITHERRSFLNLQMEINQSKNEEELWQNICKALCRLKFDMSEMYLETDFCSQVGDWEQGNYETGEKKVGALFVQTLQGENNKNSQWFWTRNGFDRNKDVCNDCLMKLELPLLNNGDKSLGTLWLIKDLKRDSISHYTLRRVEHLRRTVMGTLKRIEDSRRQEL